MSLLGTNLLLFLVNTSTSFTLISINFIVKIINIFILNRHRMKIYFIVNIMIYTYLVS